LIDVIIDVTAAHKGYFEFRLCVVTPLNGIYKQVSQECLNE